LSPAFFAEATVFKGTLPQMQEMSTAAPIEVDVCTPELCPICLKLGYVVVSFKVFHYGTPKQIRSRKACPICKLVLGLLSAESFYDVQGQSSSNQQVILRGLGRPGFFVWHGGIIRGEIGFVFANDGDGTHRHWKSPKSPWKEVAARGITPLHLPTLKAYITNCEMSHHNCTRDNVEAIDLFLLDVLDNCLVRKTTEVRYTTLSYVRGNQSIFELTSADIGTLQKPGALLDIVPRLGRVMRDALEAVRGIGERYLWIDALCIPQDDVAEKPRMIMQMGMIYSQALFTIIALNAESAASPLPGVQPGTRLKDIAMEKAPETITTNGGPEAYLAIRPGLEDWLGKAKYNSRGWTFQELVLSKRCLLFTDQQVYFNCMAEELKSDVALFREEHIWQDRTMMSKILYQNSLTVSEQYHVYMLLIDNYSRRKLSFSSDSLNAISGVLAVLSKSFGWRFRAGLPNHLLDHALLWRPGDSCHRRNFGFPSWTWAGWTGRKDWQFQNLLDSTWINLSSEPWRWVDLRTEVKHLESSPNRVPEERLDILCFEAQVVPAKLFEVTLTTNYDSPDSTPTYSFKEIWLKGSSRCGVLYELSNEPVATDEPTISYEFLALSRSRWATENTVNSGMEGRDGTFRAWYDYVCDQTEFLFSEWCFLNVLLIKRNGEYVERVAIGVIHESGWSKAMPTKKKIKLA
jgi:hypothetical protein